MISENAILYDLLKMLYIHSAKKEAQQTELSQFTTFAFLFWDSLCTCKLYGIDQHFYNNRDCHSLFHKKRKLGKAL